MIYRRWLVSGNLRGSHDPVSDPSSDLVITEWEMFRLDSNIHQLPIVAVTQLGRVGAQREDASPLSNNNNNHHHI